MTTREAAAAYYIADTLDEIGVADAQGWARRAVQHGRGTRALGSRVLALHSVWALARSPMHSVSDDRLLSWAVAPSEPRGSNLALTLRDADTGHALVLPRCPSDGNSLLAAVRTSPQHPVAEIVSGLHPRVRERLADDLNDTAQAMSRSMQVATQIEAHPSLGFFLRQEARQGDRAGVQAALAMGADPWEADASGNTALHHAAAQGRTGLIDVLVGQGAQVDQRNGSGQTPLHLAALGGHALTALALLGQGAQVRAKDRRGRTPADLAQAHQRREVAHVRDA